MPENGNNQSAAIDRYWDAVNRGERPTDHIDRSLAETIVQMRALDNVPEPDPVFVARLERDLATATSWHSSPSRTRLGHGSLFPNGTAPPHTLPATASRPPIPRVRGVLAVLMSAALLVLTLVAGFMALEWRSAPVMLPAVPAPASWSNTLVLRAGLSALPAGDIAVRINRWTFPVSAADWRSSAPSLPELLYVEAGSLVASVDTKATLARAASVKRGAVSVPADNDIPLRGGDLLVISADARYTLHTDGEHVPTLLVVTFHGAPEEEERVAPEGVAVQRLGEGVLTGFSSESGIVILRRLDLGPRAALPEEITAGPELLVVETGSVLLRAGPNGPEMRRVAEVDASAIIPGGSRLSLRNASDEPLVLLRLMVIPTN